MQAIPYDDPASLLRIYRPEECDDEGYPFIWPVISEWVRRYANYECSDCGRLYQSEGDRLTVHHVLGDKADCRKWNLVALCWPCHSQDHSPTYGRKGLRCPLCKAPSLTWSLLQRHWRGKQENQEPENASPPDEQSARRAQNLMRKRERVQTCVG